VREFWDPAGADVSLALALGLVFAAFIPLLGLVVWMARESSPPSRWLAEGRWPKAIVWLAYGLAAIALANVGWIWVYNDLIGTGRRTEQRVVYGVAIALEVLCGVAILGAQKRRSAANPSPAASEAARPKLTPRTVLIVLLFWVVLSGIYAVWTIGPMASGPASWRDRTILTVACFVIATLVGMLIDVSRKARRERSKRDGDSTGSK